jgi:predicted RNA-binding protein with PUA-like domain
MTIKAFKEFLNDQGCKFKDPNNQKYTPGMKLVGSNLSVSLLRDVVGVGFYSNTELDNIGELNGPWLATSLLSYFTDMPGVDVRVPKRRKEKKKKTRREGSAAECFLSNIKFDKKGDNDVQIRRFGEKLAQFLLGISDNEKNAENNRYQFSINNEAFVKGYAERRIASGEGLSKEELTNQEIQEKTAMTDSAVVTARGKSTTGSASSEDRPGTDDEESDLYLLVADLEAWGYTLKEMSIGAKQSYDVNDDNGRSRAHMRNIYAGNYLLGYQTSKSGPESAAIVSVLRCASASDGNKDKVEFEKVCDLKSPITLGDLKENRGLKDSKAIKGNFQQSLWRFRKSEVTALAELMKANDPYVVSMIIAAGASGIRLLRNKIMFGAPGTGKSFNLEKDRKKNFLDNYERVTFYPTYSYAQFVGTYKPVMKPIIGKDGKEKQDAKGNVKEDISYEFVPGPFLRMLVKALNHPEKNWCLIIEEINRANAAAVFGDVFQLLDRGANGLSEYFVTASEDVKKYLEDNKLYVEHLKIPANMYIWATMNSADQGVFPMDTAFKRRWEFEYIDINDGEGEVKDWIVKPSEDDTTDDDKAPMWIKGKNNKWNNIRMFINGLLTISKDNEDKVMGPFFVKAEDIDN